MLPLLILAVLLPLGLMAGCGRGGGAAPVVLARVNGEAVTQAELDKLYQQQTAGAAAPLSGEQDQQLRLALLNQLIDRHILLQLAARDGVTADPAQLQRELAAEQGRQPQSDAQSLRQQLSDALTLDALMQQEVGRKVQIDAQQIDDFYQQNQASFHLPERQFHVLEIVVTPTPGTVTNLAEDKAATPAAARKKIEMLARRLQAKADFATLAQQYSEDASTASSGGDLGLIPQSVLDNQTPAPLRNAILALRPGQVSPVIATPTGFYLLKLVAIEPAGLRPLSDPQVRQSIHDLLANAREQVLQAAFLATARDQARVENYYAQSLLDGAAN